MNDSGSKTEKATPKKRSDARKQGQVLKSTEVNVAASCLVMFATLKIIWPSFTESLANIYFEYLSMASILPISDVVQPYELMLLFQRVLLSLGSILLPILGASMLVGVAANVLQVGFMFTTKPLQPKLSKISPLQGFKRMFSSRTLVELGKSLVKVIVLGYVVYTDYTALLEEFPTIMGQDLYLTFLHVMDTIFNIALKLTIVLVVIALADYLFQWWKFEKDLRMTKQEVKDEYKQVEGDPQIKGKIRQKQRQISAMRMMQAVPSADVVITNPTHYAVALKYEDGVSEAPLVVAKGQDFLARKIKEIARENGIELFENKPLAQALYAYCDVGDMIPAEYYQAVADILVYVYRQKNPRRVGAR